MPNTDGFSETFGVRSEISGVDDDNGELALEAVYKLPVLNWMLLEADGDALEVVIVVVLGTAEAGTSGANDP